MLNINKTLVSSFFEISPSLAPLFLRVTFDPSLSPLSKKPARLTHSLRRNHPHNYHHHHHHHQSIHTINYQLLNRVNATKVAALSSQPSLGQAVAAASGAVGSAQSARNASKALARAYWFLNRTIAYNPTNVTQVKALASYTYRRLQFESLLKQGEKEIGEKSFFFLLLRPFSRLASFRCFFFSRAFLWPLSFSSPESPLPHPLFFSLILFLILVSVLLRSPINKKKLSTQKKKTGFAFTTTSAVPSFGGGAVVAAAANITCFIDPSSGIVTNLQQASKIACTAGGQRVVVPTAGKYVTKLEMAVDKDLPLVGRFVFHVRDTLDSKPKVFTCGFAGGEAISLFPAGYGEEGVFGGFFLGEREKVFLLLLTKLFFSRILFRKKKTEKKSNLQWRPPSTSGASR